MATDSERQQNYDELYKDIFGSSSPTFNTNFKNVADSDDHLDEFEAIDNYGEAEMITPS